MSKWITAYLASWQHHSGRLPTSEIRWSAMTHLCYFAVSIDNVGTEQDPIYEVNQPGEFENITAAKLADIVPAAHANDTPIIISFGGDGNDDFIDAINGTDSDREKIATEIVQYLIDFNFDGVDLDPEPVSSLDDTKHADFINRVRGKLDSQTQGIDGTSIPLLIFATNAKYSFLASVQNSFDQINLMTYDFSGAFPGWMSWYNSNVFSKDVDGSDQTFHSTGALMPSIDREVNEALAAGIEKTKLGFGMSWYAFHWQGGQQNDGPDSDVAIDDGIWGPRQEWPEPEGSQDFAPTVLTNREFFSHLYPLLSDSNYTKHFDDQAKAAYLSRDEPSHANDEFVSYDNAQSIDEKFAYLQSLDVGGMIIWEIGTEYVPGEPEPHPLISEVELQKSFLDREPEALAIYTTARDEFAEGNINLLTDDIKVALVTGGYFPDQNNDEFWEDIITESHAITAVDATNDIVSISGDQTAKIQVGETIEITGSTGNDGIYTVSAVSYDDVNDKTDITTTEDIVDATADGNVIVTHGEASATGYPTGGWSLANKVLNKNDSDRRYYLDADNIQQAITGSISFRFVVIRKDTGDDATSQLIAYIDLGSSQVITDNTLEIRWNDKGILSF